MGENKIQDREAIRRIEELIVSDRASTMMVCMRGTKNGEIYGEIYNCYLREPVPFDNAGDMVLKLYEMCDWVGAPHATTEPRFLNKDTEKWYWEARMEHPEANRDNLVLSTDQIPFYEALKAREVLIVYVKYRQNSSMQGSVRGRVTGGINVSFRSAMELMRMVRMIQL